MKLKCKFLKTKKIEMAKLYATLQGCGEMCENQLIRVNRPNIL